MFKTAPASLAIVAAFATAGALALTACEQAPSADGAGPADDHEHAPGEDHADDAADDAAGDQEEAHGEPHDLGAATIGAFEVQATRYGALAAGAEASFDLAVSGEPRPAAIRVWIGTEDARGAVKARAEADGDHYHAHVETPDPLPQGAALWVELEAEGGQTSAGSFPLAG